MTVLTTQEQPTTVDACPPPSVRTCLNAMGQISPFLPKKLSKLNFKVPWGSPGLPGASRGSKIVFKFCNSPRNNETRPMCVTLQCSFLRAARHCRLLPSNTHEYRLNLLVDPPNLGIGFTKISTSVHARNFEQRH